MRLYFPALGCAAALLSACDAAPGPTSAAAPAPAPAMVATPGSGNPLSDPASFPIAVWWPSPTTTGQYGPYKTQAAAMAGEKMNIVLGITSAYGGEHWWPEKFGKDLGELAAIKAAGLYLIGGVSVPTNENTSNNSVASILALAKADKAESTVLGYNLGDEPDCAVAATIPAAVAEIKSFDPTRIVTWNHTPWMRQPQWTHCTPAMVGALQAVYAASFDLYPFTNSWMAGPERLYQQGITTRAAAHYARPGQAVWAYIESGSDSLGFSNDAHSIQADLTAGSPTIVNHQPGSKFGPPWIGLTLTGPGVPAGATLASVIDATHANMSAPATATAGNEKIAIGGGIKGGDCLAALNLCVASGNDYRATPGEVNAEVWMSLINGATGIEWFCHDTTTASFCLGDAQGGADAARAAENITAIDGDILHFAPILNSPTIGGCSMDVENYTTGEWSVTSHCQGGALTMAGPIPGAGLVKRTAAGATYLIAQSARRGAAHYLFTLPGATATVVYDSAARYHPAASSMGKVIARAGGGFSDTLGAGGDYQVKIYAIH